MFLCNGVFSLARYREVTKETIPHRMHEGPSLDAPLYSICMCNFNMAETLEASLTSLLAQLDQRFEVVIVDDGSSDRSIEVVKSMSQSDPKLRLVELSRDPKRKLGMTRNISIQEARGSFVLLHLDCDDVFGPFIGDFVEVFHRLESCIGQDILLSGQHINMARRDFLLRHGPYINIYRGEDRNLWSRMAAIGAYVPFDHVDFITRLPKRTKARFFKIVCDTIDHMRNDFRSGVTLSKYVSYEWKKTTERTFKYQLFRYCMLLPSWILSCFDQPLSQEGTIGSPEAFGVYREQTRGTYKILMKRWGGDPNLDFLRPEARRIFEQSGLVQAGQSHVNHD